MFVNTAAPEPSPGALIAFEKNGDPATKVDLLLLGDGYTAGERRKFEADARRLLAVLFSTSPFKERRSDFNVWGLVPAARESGISRPSGGIHRSNPVSSTYDAFGSERYVLAFDNKAFRRYASYAPYDVVEIVVNGRTYGGGGIYGLYSTVAADNASRPTCSSTSSATTSRRWPTSTTRRRWPICPRPPATSRGSRTSPRCSIRTR